MNSFLAIVGWELRTSLRRISTWIYFGIFAFLGFMMMLSAGGVWDDVTISLGGGGKVMANAPYALMVTFALVALFGVSVTAAVSGNALYRDYETGIHPLFHTTPVSKPAFFLGRFTGSLIVNLIIMLGIAIGTALATAMPWMDADKLGPFQLMAYVQPYLVFVIPNLLITAAIFFTLAGLTRSMLPNYVGAVVLLIGYLIGTNLTDDLDNTRLAALVDPFGVQAMGTITRYWSIADKNARIVSIGGDLALNRLIWLSVGLLILAVGYVRFQFAHAVPESRKRRKKQKLVDTATATPASGLRGLRIPTVSRAFGWRFVVAQYLMIARSGFWGIVKSRYFIAIAAAGLLFLIFASSEVGKIYGTTTHPVTYGVEELLSGSFGLFMLVIIVFYSGELVWNERDLRIHQITDATPASTLAMALGKFTALAGVIAVLTLLTMLCGIVIQAVKGYYNFEIGLYLKTLFGMRFVDYLFLAVLALVVQVLVNHKYLGHFVTLLLYIGMGFLGAFGLEHKLYQYGSDGGVTYSDMNGFGPFMGPFIIWKLYWGFFAVILLVLAVLFWVRGQETQPGWRAALARQRFSRPVRALVAISALGFIGLGGFIFYNTNVLNEYRTSDEDEMASVEYERRYRKFAESPQPRIVAVNNAVDIFPEGGDLRVRGEYVLHNRTASPIDTVHLRIPREAEIDSIVFDRPSTRVLDDRERQFHMYRLASPLAVGDSIVMRFALRYETRGFENEVGGTSVTGNGTFFNSGVMPGIGYSAEGEISNEDKREKHGLPKKEPFPPPTDSAGRMNTYIAGDADWIDFETTVSTSPDQIAIAPGYLQRDWTENGRRYFHYKMDAPMLAFYAYQSARYAVKRDRWNDVAIEVYYHPGHEYNLDRMIAGVKKSLDYYTASFGPYQHRQVRIIEFPRYDTFAQAFANTIPFSEGIGFVAKVNDEEEDIDYPFYVTAHEVAHQWWAHQVIGGAVQGSTMLSETMSQYSALMVMEKEYGPRQMKKFLEYELDRYLFGRGTERRREQPLAYVEDQPYIHYNKGSVVMYALRDYIGEEPLNRALAGFVRATKFQRPPFTTSLELIDTLRNATPDSLKYVITDLFETITLYELRPDSAVSAPVRGGADGWQVELFIDAKKLRSDTLGAETEVPMSDWIDIGVYADSGGKAATVPTYLEKHRITSGAQRIVVRVPQKPARAGIDPLHKLIDRITRDNVIAVREREGAAPAP